MLPRVNTAHAVDYVRVHTQTANLDDTVTRSPRLKMVPVGPSALNLGHVSWLFLRSGEAFGTVTSSTTIFEKVYCWFIYHVGCRTELLFDGVGVKCIGSDGVIMKLYI